MSNERIKQLTEAYEKQLTDLTDQLENTVNSEEDQIRIQTRIDVLQEVVHDFNDIGWNIA